MRTAALALLLLTTACSFHSTATHWNGVLDADGRPVFLKTTTNVGVNLLVVLPLMGNTTIDAMVDETTREIASTGGTRVRTIQSTSTNHSMLYWPFSLVITPVITDVAMEYEPSAEELERVQREQAEFRKRQSERVRGDNSHIVPGRREVPDQSEVLDPGGGSNRDPGAPLPTGSNRDPGGPGGSGGSGGS
ncbi:MAG: hypothetical protein KAI24_19810 [Planctomycetes bacterium]|nr:hypothetical protein [Planctomycetota bacterium]